MFNLIPVNRRGGVPARGDFFSQVVDNFFRDDFFAPFNSIENSFRVDLKESDKDYVICADLPGVKKEDIEIRLESDYLTISAKRNEETETKEDNYLRRERRYGEFNRSFHIANVSEDNIDAEFKDGVLTVTLPKRETASGEDRKILIR